MIVTIAHKGLRKFWQTGDASRLPALYVTKIRLIMGILDSVQTPERINIPFGKPHALTGNLKGYLAISISANWRIIFRVEKDGNVYDVDIIDYH